MGMESKFRPTSDLSLAEGVEKLDDIIGKRGIIYFGCLSNDDKRIFGEIGQEYFQLPLRKRRGKITGWRIL